MNFGFCLVGVASLDGGVFWKGRHAKILEFTCLLPFTCDAWQIAAHGAGVPRNNLS